MTEMKLHREKINPLTFAQVNEIERTLYSSIIIILLGKKRED